MPSVGAAHDLSLSRYRSALRPTGGRSGIGRPSPPVVRQVLPLQRALGNQAVARFLAGAGRVAPGSGPALQRLVADTAAERRLYVPTSWMDTALDNRQETVRQAVADSTLRAQLLANVRSAIGVDIRHVNEVAPPGRALATITRDRMFALNESPHRRSQLKRPLAQALQDHHWVTVLPASGDVTIHTLTDRRPIIRPNEIVASAPTLTAAFPIAQACALIAVVKSYGPNRAELNQRLNVSNLPDDLAYYLAMHRHYFGNQRIDYAEPSTHPAIYREWGFKLIFSGFCTFEDLPNHLTRPLPAQRQYIFDVVGHSVFVRLKRDVTPGMKITNVADVFEFHSDSQNFNKGEANFEVNYIFEK